MSLPEASASSVLDRATVRRQKALELLHVIIDRLESDPRISTVGSNGHSEQIVLDVEGSRARYLLVRLPKSQSPPMLSPREQEIVRMVAQGHPNKVIAGVLNISCWTVGTHLRRVFSKLGVTSRAAMIARLIEQHSLAETGLLGDAKSSNSQNLKVSVEDQPFTKKPSTASAVHCVVELGKRQ